MRHRLTMSWRHARRLISFAAWASVSGCAAFHHAGTQDVAGCPPVTADPRWNDIHWSDPTADGSRTGSRNRPPAQPPSFDPALLVGRFDFIAVATAGMPAVETDTVRRGRLTLHATDTLHIRMRCQPGPGCELRTITHPVYGALDPRFEFPGPTISLGEMANDSPDTPGVRASFNSADRELTFELGNPHHATDSGMFLEVFRVNSAGFTGRWVNGSIVMADGQRGEPTSAQGYFCAIRVRD